MKTKSGFSILLLLLSISCFVMVGCTSTLDLSQVVGTYRKGYFDGAIRAYESRKQEIVSTQGRIVFDLDYGMLSMMAGDYSTSNTYFTEAENLISASYTQSIMQNIGSYLLNDNTVEYAGEDYEDIYTNIVKSLNYHNLGLTEDAMVELRRSAEKQSLMQSRYDEQWSKVKNYADSNGYDVNVRHYDYGFSISALSNYLMMVFSRSMNDFNSFQFASKQIRLAFETQGGIYNFNFPSFLEEERFDMPKGLARLNLVAFSGLAPVKEQATEFIDMPNGDIGKLSYPVMTVRPSNVRSVKFLVDGKMQTEMDLLENIDRIVFDTFRPRQELAISKTIMRNYVKNFATQVYDAAAADKKADKNASSLWTVLGLITRVTNVISEQADVRSSHFFPSKAWGTGIDVALGLHSVSIQFCSYNGNVLFQKDTDIEVKEGQTNLVDAFCPI